MTDAFTPFEDRISSDESEGAFNEFIEDQLGDMLDSILTDGDVTEFGERGSEIIVELDDIQPPTFVYGDEGRGGSGGGRGAGRDHRARPSSDRTGQRPGSRRTGAGARRATGRPDPLR